MKRLPLILLVASCARVSAASPAAGNEDLNNGEDFTRPPARFDFRYRFEDKSGGDTRQLLILRRDQPTPLGNGWELGTRLDVPLVLTDKKSSDNPEGDLTGGLGDVLFQTTLIESLSDRFALGVGARWFFPTASADQFGTGKYRLLPMLGARWKLPELSRGSYFQLLGRYDFDVGGDSGRSHISRFQFSPTMSVALPNRWFVTFFPSQDIVVDLLAGGKWFVPLDISVGRNLNERMVASLEASVPVIKQFTLYDFKLEARLGFSF